MRKKREGEVERKG